MNKSDLRKGVDKKPTKKKRMVRKEKAASLIACFTFFARDRLRDGIRFRVSGVGSEKHKS